MADEDSYISICFLIGGIIGAILGFNIGGLGGAIIGFIIGAVIFGGILIWLMEEGILIIGCILVIVIIVGGFIWLIVTLWNVGK